MQNLNTFLNNTVSTVNNTIAHTVQVNALVHALSNTDEVGATEAVCVQTLCDNVDYTVLLDACLNTDICKVLLQFDYEEAILIGFADNSFVLFENEACEVFENMLSALQRVQSYNSELFNNLKL